MPDFEEVRNQSGRSRDHELFLYLRSRVTHKQNLRLAVNQPENDRGVVQPAALTRAGLGNPPTAPLLHGPEKFQTSLTETKDLSGAGRFRVNVAISTFLQTRFIDIRG